MLGQTKIASVLGAAPDPFSDELTLKRFARECANAGLALLLIDGNSKTPLDMRSSQERRKQDDAAREAARDAGKPDFLKARSMAGLYLATTDTKLLDRYIAAYRKKYPDAALNFGIEVGRSGLIVVDCDTTEQREAFLRDSGAPAGMPPTVRSPGSKDENGNWVHYDGGHFWFTVVEGQLHPDASGSVTMPGGYAVLSRNRYVLIPPSVRPEGAYTLTGREYEAPSWLVDYVNATGQRRALSVAAGTGELHDAIEVWSEQVSWEELLAPEGWTQAGRMDNCGCEVWTAPGFHASPKSATVHDAGCSLGQYSPNAPMHIWTDNPGEQMEAWIRDHGGSKTLSKLQVAAVYRYKGNQGTAVAELGLLPKDDLALDMGATGDVSGMADAGLSASNLDEDLSVGHSPFTGSGPNDPGHPVAAAEHTCFPSSTPGALPVCTLCGKLVGLIDNADPADKRTMIERPKVCGGCGMIIADDDRVVMAAANGLLWHQPAGQNTTHPYKPAHEAKVISQEAMLAAMPLPITGYPAAAADANPVTKDYMDAQVSGGFHVPGPDIYDLHPSPERPARPATSALEAANQVMVHGETYVQALLTQSDPDADADEFGVPAPELEDVQPAPPTPPPAQLPPAGHFEPTGGHCRGCGEPIVIGQTGPNTGFVVNEFGIVTHWSATGPHVAFTPETAAPAAAAVPPEVDDSLILNCGIQGVPKIAPFAHWRDVPAPEYIVEDLIENRALTALIGQPGVGKSVAALDLACHIVSGLRWQGRKVMRQRVLYLPGEGLAGAVQRVKAWEVAHNTDVGQDLLFGDSLIQLAASGDAWRTLMAYVTEHRVGLIIFDTFARMSLGIEENSATDVGKAVQRFDQVRKLTNAGVLVVHHTGKQGDSARGSSALNGAVDTEILVRHDRDAAVPDGMAGEAITLWTSKQKNATRLVEPIPLLIVPQQVPGEEPGVTAALITGPSGKVGDPLDSAVTILRSPEPVVETAIRLREMALRFPEQGVTRGEFLLGVPPDDFNANRPDTEKRWKLVIAEAVDKALNLGLLVTLTGTPAGARYIPGMTDPQQARLAMAAAIIPD